LGYQSLSQNSTGSANIAFGKNSLFSNQDGEYNFAAGVESLYNNTDGENNIAIGFLSLKNNTWGSNNIAFGFNALSENVSGSDNVAIGYSAGSSITEGYDNLTIGNNAGSNLTNGDNNIVIGVGGQASSPTVDNEITLGNSSITTIRSATTAITSLSDRRDKTDIQTISEGIDFIKQLKPVSFTWNTRDKSKVGIKSAGFIAQDLLALQKTSTIGANLDLVSENNPEKLEARYNNLLPVMVKAIQDQQAIIEDQKKRLELLEKLVAELLKK
jgi:hypothetical protein